MVTTQHSARLAQAMAQAASGKLGQDIVALDVSSSLAITDVFLLVSASNERQVGAIVDAVDEASEIFGARVLRREGEHELRWVLLDLGDVIVHVMQAEDRQLYSLERLWKDAPRLALDIEGSER